MPKKETRGHTQTQGRAGDPTKRANTERPLLLVTGSSGLIGVKVVDTFATEWQVVGFDVKKPRQLPTTADWIECDLSKDESAKRALATLKEKHGDRVASVIHLAAYYDFSGKPSPLYGTLTVEGTRRLLHGLRDFMVEQFVFASSLLVAKPVEEGEIITEASPVEATWDYPRSKIEAEKVIRSEHGDIPAVVLRIAGVYNEDCNSLPIAQQISRIYEKKLESFFFPGDKDHGQPFIHLDDLIACFRQAVNRRRELGSYELFYIAEPDVISYDELQDRLGELIHGKEWPTIRIPKAAARLGAFAQAKLKGEESFIKPWMIDLADAHYPVEILRAQEGLGWYPKRRLRETLDDMVRSLKADPQQFYRTNKLKPPEESREKKAERRRAS
jgi:nucleoside-diphosphate-sugar epimerase